MPIWKLLKIEQEIFDALSDGTLKPAILQAQVRRFAELSDRVQAITAKSGRLIDSEVDSMRETADQAQRIMLWQAVALIPVMLFLITGFTVLISRPIRQIDAAIHELGDGNFNSPIVVSGPADLEYLGELNGCGASDRYRTAEKPFPAADISRSEDAAHCATRGCATARRQRVGKLLLRSTRSFKSCAITV